MGSPFLFGFGLNLSNLAQFQTVCGRLNKPDVMNSLQ